MAGNVFNELSDAIINWLTHFINAFSGLLQIVVYLALASIFFYALARCWFTLRSLSRFDFERLGDDDRGLYAPDRHAPLAMIAASFFCKTKRHYLQEKYVVDHPQHIPPDGFIRDAAFQYSERYFEQRFLEPISLSAELMPSLGFIGTIIGMVVHFLSNTGSLNSDLTITGIATALYTTFIGLVCYTILCFLLKFFYAQGRRRIDEGLAAVAERAITVEKPRAVPQDMGR